MTAAELSAIIVAALLLATTVVLTLVVRRRGGETGPGRSGELESEVVTGLMAELRKWQAETAYWKQQAERLQRELDQR